MTLEQLIQDFPYTVLRGDIDRTVTDVAYDSRRAVPEGLFVPLVGAEADGHDFIPAAYQKGARFFLTEYPPKDLSEYPDSVFVRVRNTRQALALLSARWFGFPSQKMTIVGITGTKGKTSTTFLLQSICREAGISAGIIGTTGIYYGNQFRPARNTTPESFELHALFRDMRKAGCKIVFMEVSSQGFKQYRTLGIRFEIGIFLNLSADHIGPHEHQSFEEYAYYKSRLFTQCNTAIACADSPFIEAVTAPFDGKAVTFGLNGGDWQGSDIHPERQGSALTVSFVLSHKDNTVGERVRVSMPGRYSVCNALAAMAAAETLGIEESAVRRGLETASVPGRCEPVAVEAPFSVLIDYAHNAVSMQNLLLAVREYKPRRILCVFGCGGNRAKARRTDMGEAAGRLCDFSVLTSDNPRFEKPADIVADIIRGIEPTGGAYTIIPDRTEAIRYALSKAEEGDIVLIIGKGHQKYEEIEGVRYPFDDAAAARQFFDGKNSPSATSVP